MNDKSIQSKFLLNPDINFLNHGSFGACPKDIFDDYQQWQLRLERDPYQFFLDTGQQELERSKQALANYINCAVEDLIYIPNPTTGINMVVKNLNLQPGDEILTTNQEYGGIDRTWDYYCKQTGAQIIRQEIKFPLSFKEEFLRQFWKGKTDRTKYIFLSQLTSSTGLIFPVKEICARAKQLGITTIIDGAHIPGHIPLDLADLDADIYVGACHKWMLAPKGNSFLYVKKELQPQMDPLIVSWGYDAKEPSESQFQDYHQFNGTVDYAAYLTTPACIKFREDNQWEERSKKCRDLLKHYYPIIAKELESNVICALTDDFLGQFCSVPIKSPDHKKLKSTLYNEYKIEALVTFCGYEMFLRVSFQAYNNEENIEDIINAIKKIKASTNLLS